MSISDYFEYNTNSPSNLVWREGVEGKGKGSGQRTGGSAVGSRTEEGYHIQVTVDGLRMRSTAARAVWEIHHGHIPQGHSIIYLDSDCFNTAVENLMCVDHSTLQYWKAWRSNKANVAQLRSGRWNANLKPFPSLGTYDTKEEAVQVYRQALAMMLESKGISLHIGE